MATWISICVCVCFLSDHPNRVVGENTQVVPRMNSKALSVSRSGRAELHMHTPRETHAWSRVEIRNENGVSKNKKKGGNLRGRKGTE